VNYKTSEALNSREAVGDFTTENNNSSSFNKRHDRIGLIETITQGDHVLMDANVLT